MRIDSVSQLPDAYQEQARQQLTPQTPLEAQVQRDLSKLNAKQRNYPERDFQDAVIQYAHLRGWVVATFRPARVMRHGKEIYETPVGADGKGFFDLVLVRERVVWVECKTEHGKQTPEQKAWQVWIEKARQEYYLWTQKDWVSIEKVLA